MPSLFPPLTTPTFPHCLLLPLTFAHPPLLPFLLGASVLHAFPTASVLLRILLLSLFLDGHTLATAAPDLALSSRLPPLHFDPRRTSGLLQLAVVAVLPLVVFLPGAPRRRVALFPGASSPHRIQPAHATALAAFLALLALFTTVLEFPPPFPHAQPHRFFPANPVADYLVSFFRDLLPLRLSVSRPAALFNLRRALYNFLLVPSGLPFDALGVQRALAAAVMALIGAINESAYLHDDDWLDATTSVAGVTAACAMFFGMEMEGVSGRVASVVFMMLAMRTARSVGGVKFWRDLLRPLAAVGAHLPWVWVVLEYRFVELALDAVRTNGNGSLLDVIRGLCEVLGGGDGASAEVLWSMVKCLVIVVGASTWERGSYESGLDVDDVE
ncbi:unnamed protein product [Chondrus crispus]|uniref:Uncharacterized protein n=1 Tax=Chondrus crispus TaxID=2769 RepID=R7QAF0_CHOCR|nr:unnamed protein product [Chondrus crispus]CDF35014.1 unnamed protein product [Chondrus crispus]|eukprot:XP_005714833.1 unnamed protein product [Chondrus crispus]